MEKNLQTGYEKYFKNCQERCVAYLIFQHIAKVGIEQFEYQLKNDTLPTQVQQALQLFLRSKFDF